MTPRAGLPETCVRAGANGGTGPPRCRRRRGLSGALTIGGRIGLWQQFLTRRLALAVQKCPRISVRAEIGLEADLMEGLVEGRLDIAVMYTPESRPGLDGRAAVRRPACPGFDRPDRQAGARPGLRLCRLGSGIPGEAQRELSGFLRLGVHGIIGWLGLQHVLENGGSGYFPIRLVRPHLQSGKLALISATGVRAVPMSSIPSTPRQV